MMWRRDPRDSHPSGTSGRHRAGQARPTTVHRRLWDGPARAQAERLAQAWPSWTVLYGVGSRRFYALATWATSEPLMIEAADAEELERRMYEAVMAVTTRREISLTAPTTPANSTAPAPPTTSAPPAAPTASASPAASAPPIPPASSPLPTPLASSSPPSRRGGVPSPASAAAPHHPYRDAA
ncbi:hypothetical protein [Streptosporangium sp. NPDC006007]|uniref:hypothetical protein n=1 Tax=Streptosporangium sp. NPDC006007 TaxID=3154575 RepID=UPI0033BC2014